MKINDKELVMVYTGCQVKKCGINYRVLCRHPFIIVCFGICDIVNLYILLAFHSLNIKYNLFFITYFNSKK